MVTPAEPFISYAQNQEDVVLSRLLPLVPVGRFIDIGAGHPVMENVTYALYLHGWRGINVEPMEREAGLLCEVRPEDQTLQSAVGAKTGTITLFEAPLENRGATTAAEAVAHRYAAAGSEFRPFEAPMITLSSLLGRLEPGAFHVVKIDVEGMEAEVLAGADLAIHRPWVLVIEATEPNSTVGTAHLWEATVLDAGYVGVLFDGLNRFYVRSDLTDVQHLLSAPANVLDRWVPASAVAADELRDHAAALEATVARQQIYIDSLVGELGAQREEAATTLAYTESLLRELDAVRQWAVSAEEYARALDAARQHDS